MTARKPASRRLRRARDRGAMAVEFAIVVPVLVLLVIGMLEFSMVMRDWLGVSSSVRLGARVASSQPDSGDAICPGPPVICATNLTPALAQSAAYAIQRSGTAMSKDLIDFIWVYKANTSGYPGPNSVTTQAAAACTTDCVKFRWNATLDQFVYDSGTWDAETINACLNDPAAQRVGVYMQATHPFLTSMIRSSMTLSDKAVMSFEPRLPPNCIGPP